MFLVLAVLSADLISPYENPHITHTQRNQKNFSPCNTSAIITPELIQTVIIIAKLVKRRSEPSFNCRLANTQDIFMQAIRIFSVRSFSAISIGEKTAASFVFVTGEWRKAIRTAPCQEKQQAGISFAAFLYFRFCLCIFAGCLLCYW